MIQWPQLTAMSDHRVVYIAVAWRSGVHHDAVVQASISTKRIELRYYDKEELCQYQKAMELWAEEYNLEEMDPSVG